MSYAQPPLISPASTRGRLMTAAAKHYREKSSKTPGFIVSRVTRAYSPPSVAAGRGMSAKRLQEITTERNWPQPLIRHKPCNPPGRIVGLEYHPDHEYLYSATQLNIGDGDTGDYVRSEHEKGNLLFVSAKFTVPEPNDPHPELFRSRLIEISFVDEPHEPHAEVLVSHSTTEAPQRTRVFSVSAPLSFDSIDMSDSSQQQQPPAASDKPHENSSTSAPTSRTGGIPFEEHRKELERNKELMTRLEQMEKQLAGVKPYVDHFKAQGATRHQTLAERIKEDPGVSEAEREPLLKMFGAFGEDIDPNSQVLFKHILRLTEEAAQGRKNKESEELLKQKQKQEEAELAELKRQQAAGWQTPLVAAHAAGGVPTREPVDAADHAKRILARFHEVSGAEGFSGYVPPAKRVATDV